ncbi:hypothetical protein BS78_K139400 [Paspalum vaginatum]|uniref:Uncharacterized protein n=1 Tax=Paspalum vaginatum TaxID=158149 RepID=A0A9W7XBE7_9POAL|nr:hypothetical protein BS78_K139400 [Paspalum vaginatum]
MAGTAATDRGSERESREKKQGSKGKKEKDDVKASRMRPERSTEQEASALRKRRRQRGLERWREMRALTNGEEDGAGGERTPRSGTDRADWSGGVRSEDGAALEGLRKAPTSWRGGGAASGGVEVAGGQEADLLRPPMVGVDDPSSMVPPTMASPSTWRRGGGRGGRGLRHRGKAGHGRIDARQRGELQGVWPVEPAEPAGTMAAVDRIRAGRRRGLEVAARSWRRQWGGRGGAAGWERRGTSGGRGGRGGRCGGREEASRRRWGGRGGGGEERRRCGRKRRRRCGAVGERGEAGKTIAAAWRATKERACERWPHTRYNPYERNRQRCSTRRVVYGGAKRRVLWCRGSLKDKEVHIYSTADRS